MDLDGEMMRNSESLIAVMSQVPEHILNEMRPLMGNKTPHEVIKARPSHFVARHLRISQGVSQYLSGDHVIVQGPKTPATL